MFSATVLTAAVLSGLCFVIDLIFAGSHTHVDTVTCRLSVVNIGDGSSNPQAIAMVCAQNGIT